VRCRLRSDTPILADLSGGLDSSSIVCMAGQLMRSEGRNLSGLRTLNIEHEGSLDKRFCAAVEEWCGIDAVPLSVTTNRFLTEAAAGDTLPTFWQQLHGRTAASAQEIGAKTYITGQLGDAIMGNLLDDSAHAASLLQRGQVMSALKQSLAWSRTLQIPIVWILWR